MINTLNELISTIKIFDGDIYGEIVRNFILLGDTNISDVNVRIDVYHYKSFLTLLHSKFNIIQISPNKFKLPHNINLNIVLLSKSLFKVSELDFDINLLTENERSLYVRFIPNIFKYIPDKLTFLKNRIVTKHFTIVPSSNNEVMNYVISNERQITLINKAFELVANNWIMDDLYHQKTIWLVGKWEHLVCKKKYLECIECSLCHDKFKPNDLVLNTVCNHTFHWNCNSTNGLMHWAKDHSTCPYCRSEMF
jgi:hypothetical protein